jgi:hypothetical protein
MMYGDVDIGDQINHNATDFLGHNKVKLAVDMFIKADRQQSHIKITQHNTQYIYLPHLCLSNTRLLI